MGAQYRVVQTGPHLIKMTGLFSPLGQTARYNCNHFLQHNGVAIEDVITQGEGLVFQVFRCFVITSSGFIDFLMFQKNRGMKKSQVYPEAIAQLPIPPLFNFLFFLMLCLLAMSSVGEFSSLSSSHSHQVYQHQQRMTIIACLKFTFVITSVILSVGTWEPIVGAILDEFPRLRNHRTLVYFVT